MRQPIIMQKQTESPWAGIAAGLAEGIQKGIGMRMEQQMQRQQRKEELGWQIAMQTGDTTMLEKIDGAPDDIIPQIHQYHQRMQEMERESAIKEIQGQVAAQKMVGEMMLDDYKQTYPDVWQSLPYEEKAYVSHLFTHGDTLGEENIQMLLERHTGREVSQKELERRELLGIDEEKNIQVSPGIKVSADEYEWYWNVPENRVSEAKMTIGMVEDMKARGDDITAREMERRFVQRTIHGRADLMGGMSVTDLAQMWHRQLEKDPGRSVYINGEKVSWFNLPLTEQWTYLTGKAEKYLRGDIEESPVSEGTERKDVGGQDIDAYTGVKREDQRPVAPPPDDTSQTEPSKEQKSEYTRESAIRRLKQLAREGNEEAQKALLRRGYDWNSWQ